jgi:RNA polymerase sigma factor (sigma-70 family)
MPRPISSKNNYWSEEHRLYAYAIARKVVRNWKTCRELDDLVSHGWYRCLRHAKHPSGTGNFLYCAMTDLIRKDYERPEIPYEESQDARVIEPDRELEESEEFSYLVSLAPDPRDRKMLRLHYQKGLTKVKIAKLYCISTERVRQCLKRAVENIRNALSECETAEQWSR